MTDLQAPGGQDARSHPSRVRGLKSGGITQAGRLHLVAPFTGAWIEMTLDADNSTTTLVAPFTGAWIEIRRSRSSLACKSSSHPSRVRGLKFYKDMSWQLFFVVAPFTGAWIEISTNQPICI